MRYFAGHFDTRKQVRGFTLIELLVVIAIIALLLGILMPSLAKVKKKARRVVCNTNLHSLGQAFHTYASDNDDRIIPVLTFENAAGWMYNMKDYYEDEDLLLCPEAREPVDWWFDTVSYSYGSWNGVKLFTKFGAPYRAWERKIDNGVNVIEHTGSYGTNGWVHSNLYNIPQEFSSIPSPSMESRWGGRMSDCNSEVPLMLDSTSSVAFPSMLYPDDGGPDDGGEPFTKAEREYWGVYNKKSDLSRALEEKGSMNYFCFDRHDKLINTVFMDGSTRPVKAEDLWTLRWTRDFPKKTVTVEW